MGVYLGRTIGSMCAWWLNVFLEMCAKCECDWVTEGRLCRDLARAEQERPKLPRDWLKRS